MIKLKNIILSMKSADFNALSEDLTKTGADKFLQLLKHYRNNVLKEPEIASALNVNLNSYYTLKSRLYAKIQEALVSEKGAKASAIAYTSDIPGLVFSSNREVTLAVLFKLEKELKKKDMPYELSSVYNALKKLHLHSPKYYDYTKLYNKHIAYMLAIDKGEDLLGEFNRILGDYCVSKDKNLLDVLLLVKKEMSNLTQLYESHHLNVYKNILDISFALFVPLPAAVVHDHSVEELLDATCAILNAHEKDVTYKYLLLVLDFLSFEYYHRLRLYKNATPFFDKVNAALSSFLQYNFCSFGGLFLESKVERYLLLGREKELYREQQQLLSEYAPDKSDVPNYFKFIQCLSAGIFHKQKYREAISLLNNFLNEVSLKSIPHAEIEIKLTLVLCYCLVNSYETIPSLIQSVSRKIREINKQIDCENASIFIKIINLQLDTSGRMNEVKLRQLIQRFELVNQGTCKILGFIKWDEKFLKELSKWVK